MYSLCIMYCLRKSTIIDDNIWFLLIKTLKFKMAQIPAGIESLFSINMIINVKLLILFCPVLNE